MCGKLFLLAVVCVSFVQVRGDEHLEGATENGLKRLRNLTATAGNKLEYLSDLARQAEERIRYLSSDLESYKLKEEGKITVQTEANRTKEKAKNSHLPGNMIYCVDGFNKEAIEDINELYRGLYFWHSETELQLNKDIRMHCHAAEKLGRDFRVKITYAESEIRNSVDLTSVERAVAVFELHFNSFMRNIDGFAGKVQQDFTDYVEQVKNRKREFKMGLEEIISMARWNFRLCLLNRNAILAILLGLEK